MAQDIDRSDDDADDSPVRTFPKGATLFREGQVCDVAYLIKKGRVSIYRVLNNKRVRLGERGPGEMVGEMGVFTADPRGSTAEALEYTEALVCDKRLLQTMLLKSPRPVQLLTGYLVDRVRALAGQITDRPSGDPFLAVCRVTLLAWQGVARGENPKLAYADLCRTIKDILLLSQIEIDAIFERLQKLHLVSITEIKGNFPRTNILGAAKPGPSFVKDRFVRLPDPDTFLSVAKNLSRDDRDRQSFGVDLEFCDLGDFAREAGSSPELIIKKIGYGDIPEKLFFFHKSASRDYIAAMGPEFFKQARRPRLTAADLEHVDDIASVDNATLQEVFSSLGFHKVAVLAAMAGEAAREKIFKNLSKKIAGVVREEATALAHLDDDEAAAVEQELLDRVKTIKGLVS
ncbi:MAG: cyclic nucleotide-binding domain-containing protein [Acidobacteriota bacterium]